MITRKPTALAQSMTPTAILSTERQARPTDSRKAKSSAGVMQKPWLGIMRTITQSTARTLRLATMRLATAGSFKQHRTNGRHKEGPIKTALCTRRSAHFVFGTRLSCLLAPCF